MKKLPEILRENENKFYRNSPEIFKQILKIMRILLKNYLDILVKIEIDFDKNHRDFHKNS